MSWEGPIGNLKGPQGISGAIDDQGLMPLTMGQDYIDVLFNNIQTTADWLFVECSVINTADADPLNIFPGIITNKATTGFRVWLSGMPDSPNYFLRWAINGLKIPPTPAVTYQLIGPSAGQLGDPSAPFTVKLLPSTTVAAPVVITPQVLAGGTTPVFTPSSVTLTTDEPVATFIYMAGSGGAKTIGTTNNGGLTDPPPLSYMVNISIRLLANLISYWTMDEASGSPRNDSIGTNHLAETGGALGSFASIIGNGAYFNGGQALFHPDNPTLEVTGDFTFSLWVRVDAEADSYVIAKADATPIDYLLSYSAANGFTFTPWAIGGAGAMVGAPAAQYGWSHIVAWWDSATEKAHLRINDATTYNSTGSGTPEQNTSAGFYFGVRAGIGGYFGGLIDEVGFWKRKLNSAEITALYNGGAGLPFSSFTAGRLREALETGVKPHNENPDQ